MKHLGEIELQCALRCHWNEIEIWFDQNTELKKIWIMVELKQWIEWSDSDIQVEVKLKLNWAE